MRWCGNVGSAFHVKVTAVFIALVAGYKIDAALQFFPHCY